MAKRLISTLELDREEWLNYRNKSIGGSDCASILGLNKYKSPYSLWAEKKGYVPTIDNDNEIMRQGRDLESYVAERFCEQTGKKVKKRNYIFLHDEYDFISANIDREIVGENAGLECKTTSVYNKTDFDSGDIPQYYYCQCMHYMAVMGYDKMYLAVLVLSKKFYIFEIERNEDEITSLLKQEINWWNKYIINDEIPEIDGSDSTLDTINLFNGNKELLPSKDISKINNVIEEYQQLIDQRKFIEKKEKELKNIIISTLENAEVGISNNFTVAYKPQTRTSIDSSLLKKELPNIYDKFSKSTEFRTLKIKSN